MRETCPLVLIRWEDSAQPVPRWQHLSELSLPDVVECATTFTLSLSPISQPTVAQSIGGINADDNVQASGVMAIPARCVISIEPLEEVEPLSGPSSCPVPATEPTPPQISQISSTLGR